MKRITILGSTGSIGTQALDVISRNPEHFQVSGLACGSNIDLFRRQLAEFHPAVAVMEKETYIRELRVEFPEIEFLVGMDGLVEVASQSDCDMVLNSLSGMMGLTPTYHAILAGKHIALANKETLVAGGELIMKAAAAKGVSLLPVDSEHSAIFQCLQGNEHKKINRLLLTASGGPFRGYSRQQLEKVTIEQALNHPKWKMGSKITIDSATLMNKGLEVIEACWLFDVPADQIEVVVHPQSIIHSMVEYQDHATIAQLGLPDMRVPIGYAFHYPERLPNLIPAVDFFSLEQMTFERPDRSVFRCLDMAYEAMRTGGSMPVVLNAANEVLVKLFLEGKIGFTDIQDRIHNILEEHTPVYHLGLEDILEIDRETRGNII